MEHIRKAFDAVATEYDAQREVHHPRHAELLRCCDLGGGDPDPLPRQSLISGRDRPVERPPP